MRVSHAPEAGSPPETDEELIARATSGDRRAFGTLYDRHSRVVYALAITTLRDRSDAEEVLSDTFLTLWRKRATVSFLEGSALPWLIVTTRYQSLNRRRAVLREHTLSLDENIGGPGSTGADEMAARNLLTALLDEIVERLAPLDQRVVRLCLIDGFTYEQAARRLGVSHSTVRNRLSRARIQLRHELRPEAPAHD
jgi:RNA polymerase sigma-70 factor (ECF subfamily)